MMIFSSWPLFPVFEKWKNHFQRVSLGWRKERGESAEFLKEMENRKVHEDDGILKFLHLSNKYQVGTFMNFSLILFCCLNFFFGVFFWTFFADFFVELFSELLFELFVSTFFWTFIWTFSLNFFLNVYFVWIFLSTFIFCLNFFDIFFEILFLNFFVWTFFWTFIWSFFWTCFSEHLFDLLCTLFPDFCLNSF